MMVSRVLAVLALLLAPGSGFLVPEPDCRTVPCKKGTYCRLNRKSGGSFGCAEDGRSSCVPYVKEGGGCGGFTLACYHRACDPAVHKCVTNPMIADAPGVCKKKVLGLGDICKIAATNTGGSSLPVGGISDLDRSGDCAKGLTCKRDSGASSAGLEVYKCVEEVVRGPVGCELKLCPGDYPPRCGPGEEWYMPEGGCCVKCRKADGVDCSRVTCPSREEKCPFGSHIPHGECCPKCNADCRLFRCSFPKCKNGVQPVKAPGSCCLSCPPAPLDCSATTCVKPTCPAGAEAYTPEGECCQRCRKCEVAPCLIPPCPTFCDDVGDCNLVRCKGCASGEVAVKVEGSCCPKCEPAAPCRTSCGRTVPHGWSGNDDGTNHCNHCSCHDGGLGCTRIGCLEKRDPTCLKKGDVCKLGGVDTGKGPDRSEECPDGTFCTEGEFDKGGHATFTCEEPRICCFALPRCKQGFVQVPPTKCTEAEFLAGTCMVEAMCCVNFVCKRSA